MLRLLVLLLVVSFAPTAIAPTAHAEEKLEPVTLAHFGQSKFLLYMPVYVAMEAGHFRNEGLDVKLKFAGNDNNSFSALIAREADFAIGDPVFAAIAREKGGKGKVVAMLITSLGFSGVTNNPAIPDIKKVEQLDGLRISSFAEPSTAYTLLSEMKRKHNLQQMQIVQAPFGAQIATLEAGRTDIATDVEPNASIAEAKGYRRVLFLSKFHDRQAVTGITTMDSTISERPQTVQKFVNALQSAVAQMYRSPEISYAVGEKMYPDVDPKVVKRAVDIMLGEKMYPHRVVVDDKLWQRTLQTRLDSGELKAPQATSETVDNTFAQAAQH